VNVVVAESLDDGGEEVCHGAGADDASERDTEEVHFGVLQCKSKAGEGMLVPSRGPVINTNVFLKTPNGELALLLCEPLE